MTIQPKLSTMPRKDQLKRKHLILLLQTQMRQPLLCPPLTALQTWDVQAKAPHSHWPEKLVSAKGTTQEQRLPLRQLKTLAFTALFPTTLTTSWKHLTRNITASRFWRLAF